ncbi:MAG: hypothetical protein BMS9Abin07_0070 [Acidimicrobiia bacterium]|nr:MAG: hypothetical protein BMS9Abin07_0070 [Acidimicrobiia bacterium]
MLDGLPDPQTVVAGLKRAGVHLAKAGYEIAAGIGAFIDEIVNSDGGDDDEGTTGPVRIDVE